MRNSCFCVIPENQALHESESLFSTKSKNTYISLAGTDHESSKLSRSIQCKKNNHSAFLIFQKLCQNINKKNYISGIFWDFKSKLIYAATQIALFLPDSINCFFICSVAYIHICLFIFTFFFMLFSPRDAFYNLQCLFRFHYNLKYYGDKNTLKFTTKGKLSR